MRECQFVVDLRAAHEAVVSVVDGAGQCGHVLLHGRQVGGRRRGHIASSAVITNLKTSVFPGY